jgi:hypothetical protein
MTRKGNDMNKFEEENALGMSPERFAYLSNRCKEIKNLKAIISVDLERDAASYEQLIKDGYDKDMAFHIAYRKNIPISKK